MVVMATIEAPRAAGFTHADLDALPEDGMQHELLDGMLLVTPAPVVVHQYVLGRLYAALVAACPAGMTVLPAPLDWRPDAMTSLQPDIFVVDSPLTLREKDITDPHLALVVEIASPATRRKDRILKRAVYEESGVASYWIIDPGPDDPSILALDLVDGAYVRAGEAAGEDRLSLERPFPTQVVPADLVR